MRAVSLLASVVLVLVLAAAAVDASVIAGTHKAPASAAKKTRGTFVHPRKMRGGPQASDNWGPVYNMAYELMDAFQERNFTAASALLEDDAAFAISALGCGIQTKQQVLAAAAADTSLATYFQFGTWAGYQDSAVGALGSVALVMGPGEFANQTFVHKDVIFYFMPNQDNTKLSVVEELTDRSWAQQNNASKIVHLWDSLVAASNLHDLSGFAALLRPDASLSMNYAWNEFAAIEANNKTAIMTQLANQWGLESTSTSTTNFVIVNCYFVIGSFSWSAVMKDGTARIMNFVTSVMFDDNFMVTGINELNVMPFV